METTETTCKNNIFFLAAQPRGALETGRSCARITKVVMVVSFSTKLILNYISMRSACIELSSFNLQVFHLTMIVQPSGSARMNDVTGRTPAENLNSSSQPVNADSPPMERHVPVDGYQNTPSTVMGSPTGS